MTFLSQPVSETQVTLGRRLWLYLFAAAVMLFLIVPIFIVIPMSFSDSVFLQFPPRGFSFRWYRDYLGSAQWREATAVSLSVGSLTVLFATPLGTAAAYGLGLLPARWRKILFSALMAPLIVPVIIIAIGIFFLFARLGLTNTLVGLAAAHTMVSIPVVVVLVSAALRTYDPNQETAARSLGATRLQAFFKVTLPQIKFSVITAAFFAFLTSFDEVIISMFVATGSYSTLTRRMFLQLRDQVDPTIAAICTLLIILTSILVLSAQLLGRRQKTGNRLPTESEASRPRILE